MAENLIIPKQATKGEIYESLIPQISALFAGEENQIANMANLCAAIKEAFGFFWIGFYIVQGDELVLGPFQGPIACTRIQKGRGVCGLSFENAESVIVPNVDEFPGHIACSSLSKSEIVIPGMENGKVSFILDIDSDQLDTFDEIDEKYLTLIVQLLNKEK